MRTHTWISVLASLVILGGCGTLPDAKPFADATGSLSASIRAGGSAVSGSLLEARTVTLEDHDKYVELSKAFESAWQGQIEAAQATVIYADAIANLISTGNQGNETLEKVADSLTALDEAIRVPLTKPALNASKDLAAFVFQQVAIVRASAKLDVAMAQAQPAIDRFARLIVEDAELTLKPILRDLHKNIESSIRSVYETEDNYRVEVQKKRKAALSEALKDPSKLAKVLELDRADQLVSANLQERDKKLDAAASNYKTRLQLIDAMSAATASWGQAHRDLASAVKEKRKVSVAELDATITDLKALVKKVRDL